MADHPVPKRALCHNVTGGSSQHQLRFLPHLKNAIRFGIVLRAQGIVENAAGGWLHFDYVPGEADVREGSASVIGRLCVIGSRLDEHELAELFGTHAH